MGSYIDLDGSGYCESTECNGSIVTLGIDSDSVSDCLDSDNRVFGSQIDYFDESYEDNNGSEVFNYDCAGSDEKQLLEIIICDWDVAETDLCGNTNFDGTGWVDCIPESGEGPRLSNDNRQCYKSYQYLFNIQIPYEYLLSTASTYTFLEILGCRYIFN